jgi:hypothetical protein
MEPSKGENPVHGATDMHTEDKVVAQLAQPSHTDEFHILPFRLTDEIRGVVTGIVSVDELAFLHVRDFRGRIVCVRVQNSQLAQEIEPYVDGGMVSLQVEGTWERSDEGWLPRHAECEVLSFTPLRADGGIAAALDLITSIASKGWNELEDPIAAWKALRGCE